MSASETYLIVAIGGHPIDGEVELILQPCVVVGMGLVNLIRPCVQGLAVDRRVGRVGDQLRCGGDI